MIIKVIDFAPQTAYPGTSYYTGVDACYVMGNEIVFNQERPCVTECTVWVDGEDHSHIFNDCDIIAMHGLRATWGEKEPGRVIRFGPMDNKTKYVIAIGSLCHVYLMNDDGKTIDVVN